VRQFFCNQLDCSAHPYFQQLKDMRVSSHLLIQRDGAITQFVPFDQRAWHAGESNHRGRKACNDFSIGIELEGSDDEAYEDAQYTVLIDVVQCLLRNYTSLSPTAIVGHSDIAPTRKTDPGPAFDWQRLRSALAD
jgi:AmpD protein